jgi:ribosome-associated heat shock protein Hsp15
MTAGGAGDNMAGSIRIDRLLVYLRFARTRSAAQGLIAGHAVRRNRQHVLRGSDCAKVGDVLTLAVGSRVRVVQLLALPLRRGSPEEARSHYREVDEDALDRKGQNAIATSPREPGVLPDKPEDHS